MRKQSSHTRFIGANLRGARLERADLFESHLRGADLIDANVEGTDLEGAIFGELDTRELMDAEYVDVLDLSSNENYSR